TLDEYDFCIRAPRPTEIYRSRRYGRVGVNLALLENIAERLFFWCRCCCQVPAACTDKLTLIKEGSRATKNEIHRSFNIAIFKILISSVAGIPRILMA